MKKLLPLAMLAATLAPASYAFDGMDFTHKDWYLACDNTGTCRAAGYQDEDNSDPLALMLVREAGPGTPVQARLMMGMEFYPDESPLRLSLDGTELGPLTPIKGGEAYALNQQQTDKLLAALAGSPEITAHNDKGRWLLSTRGSSAVLRKMDDFQGRVGTTGAILVKGPKAEDKVPVPLPIPEIKAVAIQGDFTTIEADDNGYQAILNATLKSLGEECFCPALVGEGRWEDEKVEFEYLSLGEDKALVRSFCWLAAYNGGSGYWVVNKMPPIKAKLITDSGTGFYQGEISESHKGRGLGDCFSSKSWQFDGHDFVLASELSTGLCRGVAAGGIGSMPTRVSKPVE